MSTDDLVDEITTTSVLVRSKWIIPNKLLWNFGADSHLVTANYAKDENGTTSGVSIAGLLCFCKFIIECGNYFTI